MPLLSPGCTEATLVNCHRHVDGLFRARVSVTFQRLAQGVDSSDPRPGRFLGSGGGRRGDGTAGGRAEVPQLHFIDKMLDFHIMVCYNEAAEGRTRLDPHGLRTDNRGQRGIRVRTVVQARQRSVRTDGGASNVQAKDHHTEGDELIDSAIDVVTKASADASDKTVKDLILLLVDFSDFIFIMFVSRIDDDDDDLRCRRRPQGAVMRHRRWWRSTAKLVRSTWWMPMAMEPSTFQSSGP